jgi:hypothetical protein
MAVRDALIDRSYPNWALAAAAAIAVFVEAARRVLNSVVIADNPMTAAEMLPYSIVSVATQVVAFATIAAVIVMTRHLSLGRGVVFGAGLVLIDQVAPLIFGVPVLGRILANEILFWALPLALLFALAALCAAFAKPRPLTRLLGLVVAQLAISWVIAQVFGAGLAFFYSSPGSIIAASIHFIAPVIGFFLYALICFEFFAPFRADEANR